MSSFTLIYYIIFLLLMRLNTAISMMKANTIINTSAVKLTRMATMLFAVNGRTLYTFDIRTYVLMQWEL